MDKKTKATVLLVEDDPFLVDIYSTKLKEAQFEVVVATDGDQAFAKIKEVSPDVVLLDIVLPNVDGWEIMRQVQQEEKLANIKIVVLSNLGQKGEVEKGLQLEAARYLIKAHYTPSEVVEEVVKIFHKPD